jgi:hypothetical protein
MHSQSLLAQIFLGSPAFVFTPNQRSFLRPFRPSNSAHLACLGSSSTSCFRMKQPPPPVGATALSVVAALRTATPTPLHLLVPPPLVALPLMQYQARGKHLPIEVHQTDAGRHLTVSLLSSPLLPRNYKRVSRPHRSVPQPFPLLTHFLQVYSTLPLSSACPPPFLLVFGQIPTTPLPSDTVVRFPPSCSSSRSLHGVF